MTTQLDTQTIVRDFQHAMAGKLDADKIDAVVKAVTGQTQKYPANGSIAGMIFYDKIQVQVKGGKTFDGDAGGIGSPGGGALFGDVYTSDINRLYSDTVSFQFTATPVYFSVIYFDSKSNVLGTFQAGAVSTVLGTGGGKGSWS